MEIYAGNQPDGPFQISNKVPDLVKRIVQPTYGTNTNVTLDNWFSSIPLALDLQKNYQLTVIGTLRRDKRKVPLQLKEPRIGVFAARISHKK